MFVVSYKYGVTFDLDKLLYIQRRHDPDPAVQIHLADERHSTIHIKSNSVETADKIFRDISNLIPCNSRTTESI